MKRFRSSVGSLATVDVEASPLECALVVAKVASFLNARWRVVCRRASKTFEVACGSCHVERVVVSFVGSWAWVRWVVRCGDELFWDASSTVRIAAADVPAVLAIGSRWVAIEDAPDAESVATVLRQPRRRVVEEIGLELHNWTPHPVEAAVSALQSAADVVGRLLYFGPMATLTVALRLFRAVPLVRSLTLVVHGYELAEPRCCRELVGLADLPNLSRLSLASAKGLGDRLEYERYRSGAPRPPAGYFSFWNARYTDHISSSLVALRSLRRLDLGELQTTLPNDEAAILADLVANTVTFLPNLEALATLPTARLFWRQLAKHRRTLQAHDPRTRPGKLRYLKVSVGDAHQADLTKDHLADIVHCLAHTMPSLEHLDFYHAKLDVALTDLIEVFARLAQGPNFWALSLCAYRDHLTGAPLDDLNPDHLRPALDDLGITLNPPSTSKGDHSSQPDDLLDLRLCPAI